MGAQPSLIQKANDNEVLLPPSQDQVQITRDRSPQGSGRYYGYFKDGSKEVIGGLQSSGIILGTVTLDGTGSHLVSEPRIKAGALIFLSFDKPLGGIVDYYVWAPSENIIDSTSFTIDSYPDNQSVVNYLIFNP